MFSFSLALPNPGNMFSYSLWAKVGSSVRYKYEGLFCWLGSNTKLCCKGLSREVVHHAGNLTKVWKEHQGNPPTSYNVPLYGAANLALGKIKLLKGLNFWHKATWTSCPLAAHIHSECDIWGHQFPWEGISRRLWMTWKSFVFLPLPPILLVLCLLCIWEEATSKDISLILQSERSKNPRQCPRQTHTVA